MVAAELAPYARATAASDSIAALSKALRQLGHTVSVALPRYPGFESSGLLLARRLTPLEVAPGVEVSVLDAQLPTGVSLVLFDAPALSARGPNLSVSSDAADKRVEAERYGLLVRSALAFVEERRHKGSPVDMVHLHDWPAAPLAALLNTEEAPPAVLTIHDVHGDPTFEASACELLRKAIPGDRGGRPVSFLRLGLEAARVVTTVSPSYAAELDAGDLGGALSALKEPLLGIRDGVDYATFNPATDSSIESRFDAEDPTNKVRCKTALLRSLELSIEASRPLFVVTLFDADASGLEMARAVLPRWLEQGATVVVAGGEALSELMALKQSFPEDLGLLPQASEADLRKLAAAADFLVSVREPPPAPHQELVAQRYGALPLANAAGSILDAVVDADPGLETGTGFLYAPRTAQALLGAVGRALAAFRNPELSRMRRRVMRADLGWDRPARRYAQLYRRVLGEPSLA